MENHTRLCSNCGIEFRMLTSRQRLCSKPCREADRKRRRNQSRPAKYKQPRPVRTGGVARTCIDCGVTFWIHPKGSGTASGRCPECYAAYRSTYFDARAAAVRAVKGRPTTASCVDCGAVFAVKPKGQVPERCHSCRKSRQAAQIEAWYAARPARRAENRRSHTARRRAYAPGVAVERFSVRAIFDRDGWVCGICGHQIDPAVRYPHPRSASIDHVIPRSRGGAHTRANVRTACLECNCLRQDKLDEREIGMGREQGDELTDPVMYVGKVDGQQVERPAYTPADHVNLAARGWVRKSEKPAGKRAPAASPASPRVEDGGGKSSG